MSEVTYSQHGKSTREQELELLADIYRLALEACRKRKAAEPAQRPDGRDVVKESDGYDAKESIPRGS